MERGKSVGQLHLRERRFENGFAEEHLVVNGSPESDDLVEQLHVLEPAMHLSPDLLHVRRGAAQSGEADVRVLNRANQQVNNQQRLTQFLKSVNKYS